MTRLARALVPRSLRTKFLLLVMGAVVLPLALVGTWLARSAQRSGEALLRERLHTALNHVVTETGHEWMQTRATLLQIAESREVGDALQPTTRRLSPTGRNAPASSTARQGKGLVALVGDRTDGILLRDAEHGRWTISYAGDSLLVTPRRAASAEAEARPGAVTIRLPVWAVGEAVHIGELEVALPVGLLVPTSAGGAGGIGAVLAIRDRTTGVALTPLPFDPALLDNREFTWAGERWLVAHHDLDEPPLSLAAAAPVATYAAPFDEAARRGAVALLFTVVAAVLLATLFTRHLTGSLEALADGADAVARGELDRQVEATSDDEVGRVGRGFNAMTESLRRTLAELARRESLAAVGGFAASLAHEVRNPLTAIRIDLQRVEEQLPGDAAVRGPLTRALQSVQRLDQTVSGALRIARSGDVNASTLVLREPLQRAMHAAEPSFARAGAELRPITGNADIVLDGDAGALEQLVLNLLINAAQALGESGGGRAGIAVSGAHDRVEIAVWDTGPGVPHQLRDRVFDAFYSTRDDGTGLGLAIVRQIATAHGGEVTIESGSSGGTTVRVRLPLAFPFHVSREREA
jgi:signal transduction histidine kinase